MAIWCRNRLKVASIVDFDAFWTGPADVEVSAMPRVVHQSEAGFALIRVCENKILQRPVFIRPLRSGRTERHRGQAFRLEMRLPAS